MIKSRRDKLTPQERKKWDDYANHWKKEHTAIIRIIVHKDGSDGFTPDELKTAAQSCGQSVNQFVLDCIRDRV